MKLLNSSLWVTFFLILCSFGFIACDSSESKSSSSIENQEVTPGNSVGVDPFLAPFLKVFLDDLDSRGIPHDVSGLELVFESNGDGIAGVCFPSLGRVEIAPFFRQDTSLLQELIYHELGHCVLGMEHRPNSIMQERDFIGLTPATLDEFFNESFFFEFDVNTSAVPEIKFFNQ